MDDCLIPYKVAHWPSGGLILLPLPVGAGVLSLQERVVMVFPVISTPPVFLFTLATVIVSLVITTAPSTSYTVRFRSVLLLTITPE